MDPEIPEEISVYQLLKSHISEVNHLKLLCKRKQCKGALQRIPRHMRRRAASNNPKRLPKELRKFVIQNQQKKDSSDATKKRRKRRRRKIRSRNKDPRRTPLHIWFAKRFKMDFRHGLLIPYRNNLKNLRLLYRSSKKGYTVFYLPFEKSILIEFDSCPDLLYSYLGHYLSREDLQLIQATSLDRIPCTVHFYEYDRYPLNLIGPGQLTPVQNGLIIAAHKLVLESVQRQFEQHNTSVFPVKPLELSYIRLHGQHCLQRLQKKVCNAFPKSVEEVSPDRWHCFNLEQHTTKVTIDDFMKTDQDNLMAYRRYSLSGTETIDLVVKTAKLRIIWNKINANMAHLVGGLRDMEVMTVNMSALLFPEIGFLDCMVNRQNQEQKKYPMFNEPEHYVIRNRELLNEINQEQYGNIQFFEKALLLVMIEYLRGKPNEFDLIVIPESGIQFSSDRQVPETENIGPTIPIGFIQYGCFSMSVATCRAIGYISVQGFKKIIEKNRENLKSNLQDNQLWALVQIKQYNNLRPVKISLMDPSSSGKNQLI